MSKISQGEAVYEAVVMVVGEPNGRVLDTITKEQLKSVHAAVFQMFKEGITEHAKNPTDEVLLKYIPGLCNNWLRKDPRLNGNTKYQAKNPGSRAGSGDQQLKNMKLLLERVTDPTAKADIERAIEARKAELESAKRKPVDISLIPEHLRQYVQQG